MADWLKIKAEYLAGAGTLKELAEQHGVCYPTLRKVAANEKWRENRTNTEHIVNKKVQEKIVQKVANHATDRIARILALGDALLEKAEQAASELDQHLVTNKKRERTITYGDPTAYGKPTKEIIDDTEIIAVVDAPIDRQGVKLLASALKDLNDIAKVSDPGNTESLMKARELLEGLPSAID